MRAYILYICALMSGLFSLVGCTIEPELYLPDDVGYSMHITIVTDTTVKTPYASYPKPTYYEFRHYLSLPDSTGYSPETTSEAGTIYRSTLTRAAVDGKHRLVAWSNITSEDGSQVLTTIENNGRPMASTTVSQSAASLRIPAVDSIGALTIRHQPEMFYGGYRDSIIIDKDSVGSDRLDESLGSYVRDVTLTLYPRVYVYGIKIVIEDNDGHITGTTGDAVLTSMARYVDIATGSTPDVPCGVYFNTVFRDGLNNDSLNTDTVVGRVATFGPCNRPENADSSFNDNTDDKTFVFFTLNFSNGTSGVYATDVSDQISKKESGGTIVVNVNAKKVKTPDKKDDHGGGGEGFNPVVIDYDDVNVDIKI